MTKAKPPLKRFKVGRINVTIWHNDGEKGPYYSVNLDRRYKDEAGDWRTVTSFSRDDLRDVASAAEMALSFVPIIERAEAGEEE